MIQFITSVCKFVVAVGHIDKQSSEISDKNVTEINETSPSTQPSQPPQTPVNQTAPSPYPMYGPNYYDPYWYDYYSYYYPNYPQNDAQTNGESGNQNWGYNYHSGAPTPTQELENEAPMCSSCRNTPVPFWNYYPNYYNQGYESDTGKSETSSYRNTPANFDYQYYWDPYYYSYYPPPPPPGYAYPYPYSTDGYDGYCSMDEMNQIEQQGNTNSNAQNKEPVQNIEANESTTTTPIIETKPTPVETTPIEEFCDDRSETTIIDDRDHDMDADSESSSDEEDGEVEEIYKKSTSNVPLMHQLEQAPQIPLPSKTPIHMSDADVDTDTEVEEEEEEEEEEGEIEEVEEEEDEEEEVSVDNNEGDQGDVESNSEDEEEQESIASVYIDEDQMPHVLSVIYEESERSFSSRMDRESSVVSQSTIVADEDEDEIVDDDELYEKEVIAKLPLMLTETNGRVEMVVGDLNVEETVLVYDTDVDQRVEEAEEYRLNYESDATVIENEMVAVEPETNLVPENGTDHQLIRSRSNSSHVESEIEIHMDDDKDSVKSADSEIKPDITSLTHLPDVEIEKNQEPEGDEVDFWSQINTEEDILPKRQVFVNKYRDSMYSVDEDEDGQETKVCEQEVDTRTTLEKDENSSRALIESTKNTNSITTWLENNCITNHIVNKHEEEIVAVCEEESDEEIRASTEKVKNTMEHTIVAQKADNVEVIVDVVSDTLQKETTTVGITMNDEQIEKVQVDECNISNVIFTKEEIRETLQAPMFDLGLDECFKNIQNHLKLTLDNLKFNNIKETKEEDMIHIAVQEEQVEESEETPEELQLEKVADSEEIVCISVVQDEKLEIQKEEADKCSAISRSRSLSRSKSKDASPMQTDINDECDDAEVSDLNNNTQDFYVPTIKERIRALQNASRNSTPIKSKPSIELPTLEVQDKDYLTPDLIVPKSPKTSTKSSIKSVEDNSEDEIDSGVTSDMSRHISDTESESIQDIRKIIKYQRAATHSRLFKLLQDECDEEEEQELLQKKRDSLTRKESLSLPLRNVVNPNMGFTAGDESGFNSPASPITDKQVNELVTNLLKNKNVELKNVPMEMLQAAAFKILQEDRDCKDLSSSDEFNTFLSPLLLDGSATAAQTPQEFYTNNEYAQYYETWESAQQTDIPASKSFKLLQDANSQKIPNFTARCPVVADKRKENRRLSSATPTPTFVSNSCTPVPDPSLETQEVASAS